jgi:glycosyltransferase involved in cell wall biosynthesis
MIKLSILVATVPSRLTYFYPRIITQLLEQSKNYSEIEIIGLFDNKKRTVGEKRQDLLNLSKGEYLVFIDDDDRISDDYISSIIETLNQNLNTDCVVFDCICCIENSPLKKLCKYGIEFEYGDINNGLEWRGKPAHTMVYKSSIAKKHLYISSNFGEDIDWVKRACKDIHIQTRIDKVLYYYDCQADTTSETRGISDEIIQHNVNSLLLKSVNSV